MHLLASARLFHPSDRFIYIVCSGRGGACTSYCMLLHEYQVWSVPGSFFSSFLRLLFFLVCLLVLSCFAFCWT